MTALIALAFVLLSGLSWIQPVYAQTVSATDAAAVASASATPSTASAVTASPSPMPPSFDVQLQTLHDSYHGQLSDYRDAERQYQINIDQYKQVQTLVSLEAAVQATHKAQTARDQVLISYLSILRLTLSQATGIDLSQKTQAQTDVQNAIGGLQSHLVASNQAVTKDDVNQVATDFVPLEQKVKSAAYEAQTLLAIGKLQTIYDKATTLTDEINTTLVVQNQDVKQPERERAVTEIRQTLAAAKDSINQLLTQRVTGTSVTFSQSSYENSLDNLNQIFAQLSQSVNFLDELLRI